MPGFFRARKIQRSKQEQHTSQNQNEKICQQSTFLTFIIIYSSLSLSLFCFVLFLGQGSIRSFFASFWCVVSPPLFGETRNIIPPKETHPSVFSPAYTLQVRDFLPRKRLFLSLSLARSVVYPFLVFSGRYIYSHILLLLSLCGRSKRARTSKKIISSGETIRFFRYSFLRAFLFFRETLLQLETSDAI